MDDYPQHKAFGRKDEESVTKSPPRAHHDYFAVRPPLQHKILSIIYNYRQSETLALHAFGDFRILVRLLNILKNYALIFLAQFSITIQKLAEDVQNKVKVTKKPQNIDKSVQN